MARRRTKRPPWLEAAEFGIAVPQVIAHRVARMAGHGFAPSASDRAEIHRMSAEKFEAFTESWTAMSLQTMRAQTALGMLFLRAMWTPWNPGHGREIEGHLRRAPFNILYRGFLPVHRRAVANAKRFGYRSD